MGYHTDFFGEFEISPPLDEAQVEYLRAFSESRRMKRNAKVAETLDDKLRIAVGLPIGDEGGYYVGSASDGNCGQNADPSVVDHNREPTRQPGLWCQWVPTDDGTALEWDQGEKFYNYVEWLEYMIEHFFKPWGRTLNGSVDWDGDESDDKGTIFVNDNVVNAIGIAEEHERSKAVIATARKITELARNVANGNGTGGSWTASAPPVLTHVHVPVELLKELNDSLSKIPI